jgi:hypothetical protein
MTTDQRIRRGFMLVLLTHSDYVFDESNGANFVPMEKLGLYHINRLTNCGTYQREEYRDFLSLLYFRDVR